jgi:preprotein translocase subunit YajC
MADLAYAQSGTPMGPSPLIQFLPLVLVFVVFYFLLIRPQQQKAKTRQQMIDTLKRNDEVITTGGLYGRVTELNEKVVTLEIAPKVLVRVERSHVDELVSGAKPGKGSGSDKSDGKEK